MYKLINLVLDHFNFSKLSFSRAKKNIPVCYLLKFQPSSEYQSNWAKNKVTICINHAHFQQDFHINVYVRINYLLVSVFHHFTKGSENKTLFYIILIHQSNVIDK